MCKWIKCSDRLPLESSFVYARLKSDYKFVGYYNRYEPNNEIMWSDSKDGSFIDNVEEWLDETEEEITDEYRLNKLEIAISNNQHIGKSINQSKLRLREYIDKHVQ